MAAYLAEHLPHLTSLHAQLDLAPSALAADESRLEAAIKAAVTSLIRERESEVDGWKDAISQEEKEVKSLARAVGNRQIGIGRRESFEADPLPTQHEKLVAQKNQLKTEYDERLKRAQDLQGMIERLSAILGPPFEPAKPLQAVASSSRSLVPPPAGLRRTPSSGDLKNGYCKSSSGSKLVADGILSEWLDVGEAVVEELQAMAQKALDERITRVTAMLDYFRDLFFLHAELVLPPVPLSQPHHFPIQLLPAKAKEERPGAHGEFEKVLSRFISANTTAGGEDEVEDMNLKVMDEVEPEIGLMLWVEEIAGLWANEKCKREARIQQLYDQLEPLWLRLEIEQDVMDLFMDMNRGCGEATIRAYEVELERCLELRRSSLSSFVVAARREIEVLWAELMLSEEEMGDFGGFIDDEYTEELLHAHEEEAERLRAEIESKAMMLPKVREWHVLQNDEEELERSASDPNRFSRRGGAMLREEKLRKRVEVLKPKVEGELLSLLPTWEAASGRPFMVQGERVVDKILDAREAKEAIKEAKKVALGTASMAIAHLRQRAKMGLGPAKVVARPTPAMSARSQPASTLRKREAPTPTPHGSYQSGMKRQRTGPASSLKPMAKQQGRTASAPSRVTREGSSPTPVCHLPRPVASGRSTSAQPTASVFSMTSVAAGSRIPMNGSVGLKGGGGGLPGISELAKAGGRKPRRESFKPRQSLAGGLLAARAAGAPSFGVMEEEEEEDDVF